MRHLHVTALAALTLVVAGASGATTTRSGLQGIVKRGPTMPVCKVGQPCDAPAKNVVLRFLRNGTAVASARTDTRGRYRVGLPAGTYAVRMAKRYGFSLRPTRARVPRLVYARVNFFIDTGIR